MSLFRRTLFGGGIPLLGIVESRELGGGNVLVILVNLECIAIGQDSSVSIG